MKKICTEIITRQDFIINDENFEKPVREYVTVQREYDNQEHLISEISKNADGSFNEKFRFVYDENGFLSEEIIYLDEEEIAEQTIFKRDSKGRVFQSETYYSEGFHDITRYEYDVEGNLIEKNTYDTDGSLESSEKYKYENGKLVLEEVFDEEKQCVSRNIYIFDQHGNNVETTRWNNSDEKTEKVISVFNENNLRKSYQRFVNDKLVAKGDILYDDANRPIELVDVEPGKMTTTRFEYDEKGNAILQTETNLDGHTEVLVKRSYNADNLVETSEVFIESRMNMPAIRYKLLYSYTFFD